MWSSPALLPPDVTLCLPAEIIEPVYLFAEGPIAWLMLGLMDLADGFGIIIAFYDCFKSCFTGDETKFWVGFDGIA